MTAYVDGKIRRILRRRFTTGVPLKGQAKGDNYFAFCFNLDVTKTRKLQREKMARPSLESSIKSRRFISVRPYSQNSAHIF